MIPFEEATTAARRTPIRELGLTIAGTVLEPVIAQFEKELLRARITRVRPRYYLSTEWGVPEETVAIAIPFYLVRPELTLIHAERACHVEGAGPKEILQYLRHEMGHVMNYAYRLHDRKDWSERFGSMSRPYEEEYRPRPFSREFVHHLPGWYAQKHPDEDWSETFAVWMTPELDWRKEYAKWPGALRKLEYCDRVMLEIRERDPITTLAELDGDVATLSMSLEQFYQEATSLPGGHVSGLDRMLSTLFAESPEIGVRLAVSDLLRRVERDLPGSVFHWTGHMPERTRWLIEQMAERADALALTFRVEREQELTIAITSLVTALAMNWQQSGRYET
ncbi:putative zinc-binding metallopeptidase [Pendulispora albinea]|uniref:Zinc-binding metallo-peptidase n=1 Tax=Pendulispora albinea TaxID=2741071 RepID=A0ABZ2LSW5_9BACT